MTRTKKELKQIAQRALERRYGFAPALNRIELLETFSDGTYMLFRVGVVEYRFESHYKSDGTLWIDEYCVSRI